MSEQRKGSKGYPAFKKLLNEHTQTKRSVSREAIERWKIMTNQLWKILGKDSKEPLINASPGIIFSLRVLAVQVCCGDRGGFANTDKIKTLCKDLLGTMVRSSLNSLKGSDKVPTWITDEWGEDLRHAEAGIVMDVLRKYE